MKKQTKIWLVTAACLVLVGAILFSVAMTSLKWDFNKFGNRVFVTNVYTFSADSFVDIAVESDESMLYFYPSENDECKIVCYEVENLLHTVEVVNGKLTIRRNDTRELIDFLSFGGGNPEIKIYLPEREYGSLLIRKTTGDTTITNDFWFENMEIIHSTGDVICNASVTDRLKIHSTTGDIRVENVYAKSLDLSVSTGHITATSVTCQSNVGVKVSTGKAVITNLSCENFDSEGNTGDISLTNVVATRNMSVERSTGDIFFDGCDAAEVEIETDTGDVKGTFLTEKVIFAETDTGDIDVPVLLNGGRCEISTNTGDVKISIKE
ncbi:MAG: DUF4097 domain-containing protein [Ruminococcaceae bacterium]|nr:DUF4097 domain-containing protein [Oscillospiraceae bacterium]